MILTAEQKQIIAEKQKKREEEELQNLNQQMKEKFNMQEFDIEIKKIPEESKNQ